MGFTWEGVDSVRPVPEAGLNRPTADSVAHWKNAERDIYTANDTLRVFSNVRLNQLNRSLVFYSILFCSILFYSISILFYSIGGLDP